MKIAFVTDSGTGKSVAELKHDGIYSVPLQVSYDNQNFMDLEDLSLERVYELMKEGKEIRTSLPSLGSIEDLFQSLKKEGYEMIFAVPICSGLSGTINAMVMCAEQVGIAFDYLDCHVTAVVQEYLIKEAKYLYEKGNSIEQIKEQLETVVDSTNTVLLPDDLQHLKRGGRLTPLAATLGGLLKIKPVLQINKKTKGKIDVLDKVRTMSKAMDTVISNMKKEGVDNSYSITIAHADSLEGAIVYQNKVKEAFPDAEHHIIPLVSVVGVHTGRGCQAIQYYKKLNTKGA